MLDKGTFGTVFMAWDCKWRQNVALKVAHTDTPTRRHTSSHRKTQYRHTSTHRKTQDRHTQRHKANRHAHTERHKTDRHPHTHKNTCRTETGDAATHALCFVSALTHRPCCVRAGCAQGDALRGGRRVRGHHPRQARRPRPQGPSSPLPPHPLPLTLPSPPVPSRTLLYVTLPLPAHPAAGPPLSVWPSARISARGSPCLGRVSAGGSVEG
eukprot:70927-Rhodomonas_salina.1